MCCFSFILVTFRAAAEFITSLPDDQIDITANAMPLDVSVKLNLTEPLMMKTINCCGSHFSRIVAQQLNWCL